MSMPTYIRKYWIKKHNRDAVEQGMQADGSGVSTKTGEDINAYAKIEQKNKELGL